MISATRLGYWTPWAIFGSIVAAIGTGLMTTFTISSSAGQWIGYQILTGMGRGLVNSIPTIAIQNTVPKEEVAVGTAIIVFSQIFGGAVMVSVGQTVFISGLSPALAKFAPTISAATLIKAGATNVRSVVPEDQLSNVLKAYNQALTQTYVRSPFCLDRLN
jgi:hypothetical protein